MTAFFDKKLLSTNLSNIRKNTELVTILSYFSELCSHFEQHKSIHFIISYNYLNKDNIIST